MQVLIILHKLWNTVSVFDRYFYRIHFKVSLQNDRFVGLVLYNNLNMNIQVLTYFKSIWYKSATCVTCKALNILLLYLYTPIPKKDYRYNHGGRTVEDMY